MKPLLDTSSPIYLKRLVRVLNALPDGFYCGQYRFVRARFKAATGTVQMRHVLPDGRSEWCNLGAADLYTFTLRDAYDRAVFASRSAK